MSADRVEQIIDLCKAMGAGEEQEVLLRPLAQAAQELLAARLKPGVEPDDCGPAFPLAAAMTAMEGLERTAGGEVTAFTAGELTIRRESGGQGKSTLSAQAERLLAPWLGETGFAFQGVRG